MGKEKKRKEATPEHGHDPESLNQSVLILLHGNQCQLNATVLFTSAFGVVGGNRVARAITCRTGPLGCDTLIQKEIPD